MRISERFRQTISDVFPFCLGVAVIIVALLVCIAIFPRYPILFALFLFLVVVLVWWIKRGEKIISSLRGDLEKMSDEELDELSTRAIAEQNFRCYKDDVLKLLKEACVSEASGEEEWMMLIEDNSCLIFKKDNKELMEKIFGRRKR